MSRDISSQYNPSEVEDKIYRIWEKSGFFNPDKLPARNKKTFCITMAPPNITGHIHIGHALENTLSDILIRKKRMEGCRVLFLPGKDHAGIAAQYVVDRELRREGKNRFDLGKEKFLEKMRQWMKENGRAIDGELKTLGLSCDWTRERFTLDERYQKAVKTAFEHYYKLGWIYRGKRIVNWCSQCQTSISDLEVIYTEEKSSLWHINYPLKDGGGFITVATTRPETMLGDAAVAVNPKDKRYKNLVGKILLLPIQNREIPVVADPAVDQNFGTGAVKVTPAHDPLDFEIARRRRLPVFEIINENGRMNKNSGPICAGLKVSECREKVIAKIKELGLLEREEEYIHNLGRCERSQTPIEPLLSEQWFLSMKELAKKAAAAARQNKIKFFPPQRKKIFLAWLGQVRDWNISRQLWWGHQIPVWICQTEILNSKFKTDESAEIKKMGFAGDVVPQVFVDKTRTYRLRDHGLKVGDVVAFENSASGEVFGYATITEVKKTTIKKINLRDRKHPKTYNTREELLAAFKRHPQKIDINAINENTPAWIYTYKFIPAGEEHFVVSAAKPRGCPFCKKCEMEQSADVLDTWFSSALWPFAALGWPEKTKDLKTFYPTALISSAREIFFLWIVRMVFSGLELAGQVPFRNIYTHATVLDNRGRKMSKSLGNVADPMEMIKKYGTDALRFGLSWQITGAQDLHWNESALAAGKKFCNKIWNAARFVLQNAGSKVKNQKSKIYLKNKNLTPADKKILAALAKTKKSVSQKIEKYEFGAALHILYDFFWHDFCDRYLEESKLQLAQIPTKKSTEEILVLVLASSLKLLHPFMPFITEEIWSFLSPENKNLLIVEKWPR